MKPTKKKGDYTGDRVLLHRIGAMTNCWDAKTEARGLGRNRTAETMQSLTTTTSLLPKGSKYANGTYFGA